MPFEHIVTTNQFKEKLVLVTDKIAYKGKLSNEILVAVNILNNSKENGKDFTIKMGTIGKIDQVNVVRLIIFLC